MLTINDMRIGMKVLFGRPNGEKTFGEVVKINRKNVRVKTLEPRGRTDRGQKAGRLWNVPPQLCSRAYSDDEPKAPHKPSQDTLVEQALSKLTAQEREALKQHFWRQIASKF